VIIPQSSPLSFNIFFKNFLHSASIESVTSLLSSSTLITKVPDVINVDKSEVTDSMEIEFLKKMLNESGDDCGITTYFDTDGDVQMDVIDVLNKGYDPGDGATRYVCGSEICVYMYVCIYTFMYVCMYLYIYMYKCMYICMHV